MKRVAVISGDDDNVVPLRASARVAELLGQEGGEKVMSEVGHLPMDEKPEELADILYEFMMLEDIT